MSTAPIDLNHPLQSNRPFTWSPDGRFIAFLAWGERMYRNARVVSVADGKTHAVSFLGNTFADAMTWSADGESLYFSTRQRTEPGQVARVDLIARTPKFRKEQFLNLFKEQTPNLGAGKAKTKTAVEKRNRVKIEYPGVDKRLSLLPIELDVRTIALSPDGIQLLLTAEVADRTNLFLYSLKQLTSEPSVARQLTSTAGDKIDAQFSPDDKQVFYLDDGQVYSVGIDHADPQALALSAEMNVDFNQEKRVDFHQAWRWLKDNFHGPKMNGVNWAAVKREYAPLIDAARTTYEMRRLLNQHGR